MDESKSQKTCDIGVQGVGSVQGVESQKTFRELKLVSLSSSPTVERKETRPFKLTVFSVVSAVCPTG
jgi:hypothetical protein